MEAVKVLFEFNEGKPFGTEVDDDNAVEILRAWIIGKDEVDADHYAVSLKNIKDIKFFR